MCQGEKVPLIDLSQVSISFLFSNKNPREANLEFSGENSTYRISEILILIET